MNNKLLVMLETWCVLINCDCWALQERVRRLYIVSKQVLIEQKAQFCRCKTYFISCSYGFAITTKVALLRAFRSVYFYNGSYKIHRTDSDFKITLKK